jgi:amino acid transporter
MDTKPIYKISLAVSIILSIIFTVFLIVALFTTKEFRVFDIIMFVSFFFTFFVFILFDLTCYRINRYNKEKTQIPRSIKQAGTVLFILNLLVTLYVFFCTVASLYSLQYTNGNIAEKNRVFIFLICVFSILTIAAVINSVHYIKTSRRNKSILNDLIDDIGGKITPFSG